MNVSRSLLAGLALLAGAAPSQAQVYFGSPGTPYYSSPRAYSYGFYYPSPVLYGSPYAHLHGSPWNYPAVDYYGHAEEPRASRSIYPRDVYTPNPRRRESLYPAVPFRAIPADDTAARLDVSLPDPSAELFFNGAPTTQTGTTRTFVTPALVPGTPYTYQLQARWRDASGREQTQDREVEVRAGQRKAVSFEQGL